MKLPNDTQRLQVKAVGGLVTNVDIPDLPENYALRTRGFRYDLDGTLGTRDFGTQHKYGTYPAAQTSRSDRLTQCNIKGAYTFYDPVAMADRDVLLATNAIDESDIYVYDGSNWIRLTAAWTAYIQAVGATNVLTIYSGSGPGVVNQDSETIQIGDNEFNGYLIYNVSKSGERAIILDTTASVASPPTHATVTLDMYVGASYLNWEVGDMVQIYRNTVTKTGWTRSNGTSPHNRWSEVSEQLKVNLYYGTSGDSPSARIPVQIRRYQDARSYFYKVATPAFTLPAGWYLNDGGGGLIPGFNSTGSDASPILSNTWGSLKTGSVTTTGTPGDKTVSGSGTSFLSQYKVGGLMQIDSGGSPEEHWVTIVDSDTLMHLSGVPLAHAGVQHKQDYGHDNPVTVQDGHGFDWLRVGLGIHQVTLLTPDGFERYYRLVIIGEIDGYQYTDPLYKAYYKSASDTWADIGLTVEVDGAIMPKNLTKLLVFLAVATSDTYPLGPEEWPDSATDYNLIRSIYVQGDDPYPYDEGWCYTDSLGPYDYFYKHYLQIDETEATDLLETSTQTLGGLLAHAYTTSRAYYTPLYAARLSRNQNSLSAIQVDDSTIALSNYNGDGNHEDDNFPEVVTDTAGNRLRILLNSPSPLLGLEWSGDQLVALKQTAIELYDAQGGLRNVRLADVYSSKSILRIDDGLIWGGMSGIYILPATGGEIRVLNAAWRNFYDGTLKIATAYGEEMSTTPYITDAYRKAMSSGYDPAFREVWFHLQVNKDITGSEYLNFRINPSVGRWSVRELSLETTSPVVCFSRGSDMMFNVVYKDGILKYPIKTGTYCYQDSIAYDGLSALYGIPTDQTIHVGSVASLVTPYLLNTIRLDWVGVAQNTTDKFGVDLYANKDATPWEQLTIPMGTSSVVGQSRRVWVKARGGIERLKIRMYLSGTLTNFGKWALSGLGLWGQSRPYEGNR